VESRLENHRVRKVTVFYYLEDKSIMITEPKQSNSGVPQGAFLKRQVVLKADGTPFVPDDFCIGADTGVYGRQIRIYNTDEYTRKYYQVSLSRFLFVLLCPQEFKPSSLPKLARELNQSSIKLALSTFPIDHS